jgi:RHS repeat-associated protein
MKRRVAMTGQAETVLSRYRYDALDRVTDSASLDHQTSQRFYRHDRLVTEVQNTTQYSVFEWQQSLLGQHQRHADRIESALLATDLQRSVLHCVTADEHQQYVYSPYGHRHAGVQAISLLGFAGQRRESVVGSYLLGNGHRVYSPVLMQFCSADRLSPFGKGGLNAYGYCGREPINRVDPSGRFFSAFLGKYLQRTVQRSSSGTGIAALQGGQAMGRGSKMNASIKSAVLPPFGPGADVQTLMPLDLASTVPKGNALGLVDITADNVSRAASKLHSAETNLTKLKEVVNAKGLDVTLIPEHPAYKAYIDANNSAIEASRVFNNALRGYFLGDPGALREWRQGIDGRRYSIG